MHWTQRSERLRKYVGVVYPVYERHNNYNCGYTASSASTQQPTNSTEVCDNSAPAPATHPSSARLLCCAGSQTSTGSAGAGSDVDEVPEWPVHITALNSCYPLIRKLLYIELKASAAVEKLFSQGEGREYSLLCDLSVAVNTLTWCCSCFPLNCELLQLRHWFH